MLRTFCLSGFCNGHNLYGKTRLKKNIKDWIRALWVEMFVTYRKYQIMKSLILIMLLSMVGTHCFGQELPDIFDQINENVWYLPTEDGNANLYLTSIGKGDTIIVLNGGPGNNFNYLVDAVKGNSQDNTFVFFDQRGSILSPVSDSLINSLSMDVLVEDLESIRKSLELERISILGHSFGSLLGLFYYMKYPEKVENLILTATMPPVLNEEKPFREILPEIHQRVRDMRNRDEVHDVLAAEGLLDDSLLSPRQKSDKLKITGQASFNMYNISEWQRFKGGGVYYNQAVDSAIGSSIPESYDIREVIMTNPVPITIIQGDKDYIDPGASLWKEISDDFDFITINEIENASHNSWLDDKGKFDQYLKEAIERRGRF